MSTSHRIFRGDTVSLSLTLVEPFTTTPFNPTGWTLLATCKAGYDVDDSGALFQKQTGVGGITIVSAGAGRITLDLLPADTDEADVLERYVFDVQAQNDSTGAVKTVYLGTLRIDPEVSRLTEPAVDVVVIPAVVNSSFRMQTNGGGTREIQLLNQTTGLWHTLSVDGAAGEEYLVIGTGEA